MADPQGAQFEIHVIGDETGEAFPGKFRAKEKLSWIDRINADRVRRELLGPNGAEADAVTQRRAEMLGELSVHLTETPDWWKTSRSGLDLIDDNVVMKVHEEAMAVQSKWQETQKAKGVAARAALAEKKPSEKK